MTRLAPHLIKPHECPGCWDYVRAWLVKWLTRLLFAFFWFVIGYGCRAWVTGC